MWSRRRPQQNQKNERSEAVSNICASFVEVNKKKEELITEEIEFRRKLYMLQLEVAKKELEIKTEVLAQVKVIY